MSTLFLNASDVPIGYAAVYAVVGFCIVLIVLAILVGIFYLSGFLFSTKFLSKEKLFERKNKNAEVKDPDIIPTITQSDLDEEEDDKTVAAITAAISVILAEENETGEKPDFVIRRIVRKK